MNDEKIPPIHPGETLLGEFLEPMGIGVNQFAKSLNVVESLIEEIINGKKIDNGGCRPAIGKIFWYVPSILDGIAESLRYGDCRRQVEGSSEREVELYAV